jgi:hypothetical protein
LPKGKTELTRKAETFFSFIMNNQRSFSNFKFSGRGSLSVVKIKEMLDFVNVAYGSSTRKDALVAIMTTLSAADKERISTAFNVNGSLAQNSQVAAAEAPTLNSTVASTPNQVANPDYLQLSADVVALQAFIREQQIVISGLQMTLQTLQQPQQPSVLFDVDMPAPVAGSRPELISWFGEGIPIHPDLRRQKLLFADLGKETLSSRTLWAQRLLNDKFRLTPSSEIVALFFKPDTIFSDMSVFLPNPTNVWYFHVSGTRLFQDLLSLFYPDLHLKEIAYFNKLNAAYENALANNNVFPDEQWIAFDKQQRRAFRITQPANWEYTGMEGYTFSRPQIKVKTIRTDTRHSQPCINWNVARCVGPCTRIHRCPICNKNAPIRDHECKDNTNLESTHNSLWKRLNKI